MFNLTDAQKDLLRFFIRNVRDGKLAEEFTVIWILNGPPRLHGSSRDIECPDVSHGKLEALHSNELLQYSLDSETSLASVTLLGMAYDAVDSDFDSPDTSFIKHLSPLADVTNLDAALKDRCLPILGAGGSDPMLWDSAVRTASVILEERLRDIGGITDSSIIGKGLVNKSFGTSGTLAVKFADDSERESYRDLFAGVVGLVRNPSAHWLIDPTPEEGGILILLVNLLIAKLEALR